jgi:hypothetical protein
MTYKTKWIINGHEVEVKGAQSYGNFEVWVDGRLSEHYSAIEGIKLMGELERLERIGHFNKYD